MNIDRYTLIALAIIVYIIQNIVHEWIGHGGACFLIGKEAISVSTAYFEWNAQDATLTEHAVVAMGGSVMNLLLGIFSFFLLRLKQNFSSLSFLFLWLLMTVNLLSGSGYILFSSLFGFGDWATVINSFTNQAYAKLSLSIIGLILFTISVYVSLIVLNGRLKNDVISKVKMSRTIMINSYVFGSLFSTIGAILNPISPVYILTSALSSFAGTSALLWMSELLHFKHFNTNRDHSIYIDRNTVIISISLVLVMIHVTWLGPSIKL